MKVHGVNGSPAKDGDSISCLQGVNGAVLELIPTRCDELPIPNDTGPFSGLNEIQRHMEILLAAAMERRVILQQCLEDKLPALDPAVLKSLSPSSVDSVSTSKGDVIISVKQHPQNPLVVTIVKEPLGPGTRAQPAPHSSSSGSSRLFILPPPKSSNDDAASESQDQGNETGKEGEHYRKMKKRSKKSQVSALLSDGMLDISSEAFRGGPSATQHKRVCKRNATLALHDADKQAGGGKIVTKKLKTSESLEKTDISPPNSPTINYEIPNKFWALMEPYCAEIHEETLQYLDHMIKRYGQYENYFQVPPLGGGKVTSMRLQQQLATAPFECGTSISGNGSPSTGATNATAASGSGECESDNGNGTLSAAADESLTLMRKIDEDLRNPMDSNFAFFPISSTVASDFISHSVNQVLQKRVSACREELSLLSVSPKKKGEHRHHRHNSKRNDRRYSHSASPSKSNGHRSRDEDDEEVVLSNYTQSSSSAHSLDLATLPQTSQSKAALHNKSLAKQLQVSNSFRLEKRLRQWQSELLDGTGPEVGSSLVLPTHLLEGDGDVEGWSDAPGDEVLQLLRQKQRQLYLLANRNCMRLRRLSVLAKRESQRQEICRRLAMADADVIESYNKLESYRQARKPPLKRDRDVAIKTLKSRKKIFKELEDFDLRMS